MSRSLELEAPTFPEWMREPISGKVGDGNALRSDGAKRRWQYSRLEEGLEGSSNLCHKSNEHVNDSAHQQAFRTQTLAVPERTLNTLAAGQTSEARTGTRG